MLSGCDMVVMNPSGDVARQQANLVLISTGLMLLIIVPVMALTVLFAWKYRASNEEAKYEPNWDHSTGLELIIWSAPLLIVIALGALTWVSTHLLDPYRPLQQIARGTPVNKADKPLEIQVVALDWKWLFIYPEQGIATVNQLALPLNRQVRFRLSSSSVMNAFYVPALAGMIYTMPGMETKLHAVLNKPGTFDGFSSNYSGAGFSDMHFKVSGLDQAGFDRWVASARSTGKTLDTATYLQLEKPSEKVPPMGFTSVAPGLFDKVVNQCVRPGTPCMADTMRRDMQQPGAVLEHVPTNESQKPKAKGAFQKSPEEIAPVKRRGSDGRGQAPGTGQPGTPANQNMTLNIQRPGTSAVLAKA
ncbi:cytochrome o ubiquinol oxidase subunit II [Sphingomonas sp. EC-HK361]|nr:cytochrome o ubiquinol oxidase subunit II [Sphingomonas sp. EC-HK361]